jgi:hypothetical protein
MKRRPSVQLPCIADRYAATGERIVEFNANDGTGRGGLISLRLRGEGEEGALLVELYRLSDGVVVDVDPPRIRRTPGNLNDMRAVVQEANGRKP